MRRQDTKRVVVEEDSHDQKSPEALIEELKNDPNRLLTKDEVYHLIEQEFPTVEDSPTTSDVINNFKITFIVILESCILFDS